QNCLCVRPGAPLFPVLQRSRLGAKEICEERARKVQSLPNPNQIVGAEVRRRLEFQMVRPQRALALAGLGQGRHALDQFAKHVATRRALRPSLLSRLHRDLRDVSSAWTIALRVLRWLGVRSLMSSLS